MDTYTPINEYISIKGNKSSLLWIFGWLMEHRVDFQYDAMVKRLKFVQSYCEHEVSPLTQIIEECPHKGWDILEQFTCSSCTIINF